MFENPINKLFKSQDLEIKKVVLTNLSSLYGKSLNQNMRNFIFKEILELVNKKKSSSIFALKQLLLDHFEGVDEDFSKIHDYVLLKGLRSSPQ